MGRLFYHKEDLDQATSMFAKGREGWFRECCSMFRFGDGQQHASPDGALRTFQLNNVYFNNVLWY